MSNVSFSNGTLTIKQPLNGAAETVDLKLKPKKGEEGELTYPKAQGNDKEVKVIEVNFDKNASIGDVGSITLDIKIQNQKKFARNPISKTYPPSSGSYDFKSVKTSRKDGDKTLLMSFEAPDKEDKYPTVFFETEDGAVDPTIVVKRPKGGGD